MYKVKGWQQNHAKLKSATRSWKRKLGFSSDKRHEWCLTLAARYKNRPAAKSTILQFDTTDCMGTGKERHCTCKAASCDKICTEMWMQFSNWIYMCAKAKLSIENDGECRKHWHVKQKEQKQRTTLSGDNLQKCQACTNSTGCGTKKNGKTHNTWTKEFNKVETLRLRFPACFWQQLSTSGMKDMRTFIAVLLGLHNMTSHWVRTHAKSSNCMRWPIQTRQTGQNDNWCPDHWRRKIVACTTCSLQTKFGSNQLDFIRPLSVGKRKGAKNQPTQSFHDSCIIEEIEKHGTPKLFQEFPPRIIYNLSRACTSDLITSSHHATPVKPPSANAKSR